MRCQMLLLHVIANALGFSSVKPPSNTKGCFNYYSGSCTGCGMPNQCGTGHANPDGDGYSMPTFYTGTKDYCDHCPGKHGCWDGTVGGGPEHCTCVSEAKCVANSPAYVPCAACGADGDPPMLTLPKPDIPTPIHNDTHACYRCLPSFSPDQVGDCGAPAAACPTEGGFPVWYTGSMGRCDHCTTAETGEPDGQGCWDGDMTGNRVEESCVCIKKEVCPAPYSPKYVPLATCGAPPSEVPSCPSWPPVPPEPVIDECLYGCYHMSGHYCTCGMEEYNACSPMWASTACTSCCAEEGAAFDLVYKPRVFTKGDE
jgi:hypothetical protein